MFLAQQFVVVHQPKMLIVFITLLILRNILQSSTQEVFRIRAEHPDDNQAVLNDRVKGQLKVTRAFGAGFLKRVSLSSDFGYLNFSLLQSFCP